MPSIDQFRAFTGGQEVSSNARGALKSETSKSEWSIVRAWRALNRSDAQKTGFQAASSHFYQALKEKYGVEAAAVAFKPLLDEGYMEQRKPLTGRRIEATIQRAEAHVAAKKELKDQVVALKQQARNIVTDGSVQRFMGGGYARVIPKTYDNKGMQDLCREVCKKALSAPEARGMAKVDMPRVMVRTVFPLKVALDHAREVATTVKTLNPSMGRMNVDKVLKENSSQILRMAMARGGGNPEFLSTPAGKIAMEEATMVWLVCKGSGRGEGDVSSDSFIEQNGQQILDNIRHQRSQAGQSPTESLIRSDADVMKIQTEAIFLAKAKSMGGGSETVSERTSQEASKVRELRTGNLGPLKERLELASGITPGDKTKMEALAGNFSKLDLRMGNITPGNLTHLKLALGTLNTMESTLKDIEANAGPRPDKVITELRTLVRDMKKEALHRAGIGGDPTKPSSSMAGVPPDWAGNFDKMSDLALKIQREMKNPGSTGEFNKEELGRQLLTLKTKLTPLPGIVLHPDTSKTMEAALKMLNKAQNTLQELGAR